MKEEDKKQEEIKEKEKQEEPKETEKLEEEEIEDKNSIINKNVKTSESESSVIVTVTYEAIEKIGENKKI